MAAEDKKQEKNVKPNDNNAENVVDGDAVTPEMMNDLKARFEEVQNKSRSINSMKIMHGNKKREENIRIVQELLGKMESMGVDVSDQNSINEFIQSLEQLDPDLRELFENAFNGLMSDIEK